MGELGYIFLFVMVWGIANGGAVITAFVRISSVDGPRGRRALLGLLVFIALLLGNLGGLFFSALLGYCEHCSAKPVGGQQLLSGLIASVPGALIWLLLYAIRFTADPVAVEPPAPSATRAELTVASQVIPSGPPGACPNCGSHIPTDSPACPACKALFGDGAIWKIVPLP